MNATELKQRLRGDLKTAMQARAPDDARLLRTLIAALDNAEAVPVEGMHDFGRSSAHGGPGEVARLELDDDATQALLRDERNARLAAAEDYERHGRDDHAARLRDEAALIERYLAAEA